MPTNNPDGTPVTPVHPDDNPPAETVPLLRSPDGTLFRLLVSDAGVLSTEEVV